MACWMCFCWIPSLLTTYICIVEVNTFGEGASKIPFSETEQCNFNISYFFLLLFSEYILSSFLCFTCFLPFVQSHGGWNRFIFICDLNIWQLSCYSTVSKLNCMIMLYTQQTHFSNSRTNATKWSAKFLPFFRHSCMKILFPYALRLLFHKH
jgi:hypothetical protein